MLAMGLGTGVEAQCRPRRAAAGRGRAAAPAPPGDPPDPHCHSGDPDLTPSRISPPAFRVLRFSVAGAGLSFDQATGTVGIAADRLQQGLEVRSPRPARTAPPAASAS